MSTTPDAIDTSTMASVPIAKCATELLIKIAEYLPKDDLRSLSLVSKTFAEVAQDVLYREVSLQQQYYKNSQHHHSKIASLLWTIGRKPYLAAKVKRLTWWPRSKDVPYRMVHNSPVGPASPLLVGPFKVLVDEQRLAADLLTCFTDLRSIEFTEKDKQTLDDGQRIYGCPIVDKMPLRLNDLPAVPALAKLESLCLEEGALSWSVFTFPTLKLVELGPLEKVPMAYGGHAAPNITSLRFGVKEGEFGDISHIFSRLPNLRSLNCRHTTTWLEALTSLSTHSGTAQ
jgi:hypothetical protein